MGWGRQAVRTRGRAAGAAAGNPSPSGGRGSNIQNIGASFIGYRRSIHIDTVKPGKQGANMQVCGDMCPKPTHYN